MQSWGVLSNCQAVLRSTSCRLMPFDVSSTNTLVELSVRPTASRIPQRRQALAQFNHCRTSNDVLNTSRKPPKALSKLRCSSTPTPRLPQPPLHPRASLLSRTQSNLHPTSLLPYHPSSRWSSKTCPTPPLTSPPTPPPPPTPTPTTPPPPPTPPTHPSPSPSTPPNTPGPSFPPYSTPMPNAKPQRAA